MTRRRIGGARARTSGARGGRARAMRIVLLALGLGALAGGDAVCAADARAGKAKAQPCTLCHGANGISVAPDAPNLAGQPELYVAQQLRAFRGGERRHEVMTVIAKPLTDADIADLAAWFTAIRVEARPPD